MGRKARSIACIHLHPCWFKGDKKTKALCITNGCNTVCIINVLNAHYHYQQLQTYKFCKIEFLSGESDEEVYSSVISVTVNSRNKTSKQSAQGNEEEMRDGPSDSSPSVGR